MGPLVGVFPPYFIPGLEAVVDVVVAVDVVVVVVVVVDVEVVVVVPIVVPYIYLWVIKAIFRYLQELSMFLHY